MPPRALRRPSAGLANTLREQICYGNSVDQVLRELDLATPDDAQWPACHWDLAKSLPRTSVDELFRLLRKDEVLNCPACNFAIGKKLTTHDHLATLNAQRLLLLAKVLVSGNRSLGQEFR